MFHQQLMNWNGGNKMCLSWQPSSAAAERVFSLLNASFGTKQANSLEDYFQATIMLQTLIERGCDYVTIIYLAKFISIIGIFC